MEVIPGDFTALKAYSLGLLGSFIQLEIKSEQFDILTNLIEFSLWREDGNVSIIPGTASSTHLV